MLVAEKYAYLEELEPVVEPVQREQLEKNGPSQRQETKEVPAPKYNTLNMIMTIGLVLICFATACFTVFRYAQISENHEKILELENMLEKEYSRQENLKVELASCEDLKYIEFTATAELGMQYPEEGQVKYVDLPKPVVQASGSIANAEDASNQSAKSVLARLLGLSN